MQPVESCGSRSRHCSACRRWCGCLSKDAGKRSTHDGTSSMSRHLVRMTLDDAEHYSAAERAAIVAAYPEHEREARTRGLPALGSGLVFPLADETIACDPIEIARHWARIIGIDFGWEHPFAAVQLAWDRDADIIYVTTIYRETQATPIVHAAAIRPWGAWIPCAWPHDGLQHDKGSGQALRSLYAEQGLSMLPAHATFEDGGSGVEAGVIEMLDRMRTGRFKVFRHLEGWFAEKRLYHRKDGQIIKERDDLMSATRYAMMMKRFAVPQPAARTARTSSVSAPEAWMGG